jgi:hypothetical protein
MVSDTAKSPAVASGVIGANGRHSPGRSTRRRAPRLGPLLAVCGLVGGAGTTTVAYLTALAAARAQTGPILVADTGGPSGGLSTCAGVEAPRSLPELAGHLAAGGLPERGLFATGSSGLRVLAAGPEFTSTGDEQPVGRLLLDAREAHGLTVIDCGQLARGIDRAVIHAATHVAWIVPASHDAIVRGSRVLDAAPHPLGRELIVARDAGRRGAPVGELRRIAAEREALLVLLPHVAGLGIEPPVRSLDVTQIPIQAILGALER